MARIRLEQRGQGTIEYVGAVLVVAALFATLVAGVPGMPGGELARTLAGKLICAVRGDDGCSIRPSELERTYGDELAGLITEQLPELFFEDSDFASLPVDFRECRERACSDSILDGSLERTQTGLAPTVFVHPIDCRDPAMADAADDCSGAAAGNLYLQFWFYYPDSHTNLVAGLGYHVDDWESLQVRIGPGGIHARASSHHSYNGAELSLIGNAASDAGKSKRRGWDTSLRRLNVAAGSHAGVTGVHERFGARHIEREDLKLIPIKSIRDLAAHAFEVTPPWEKAVWHQPESDST